MKQLPASASATGLPVYDCQHISSQGDDHIGLNGSPVITCAATSPATSITYS